MTPRWLQDHLIEIGVWNNDGVSRKAKVRWHPCGARIVVGLDADMCALPAVCDLVELTPLAEALAQLGARRTYALRGHHELSLDRRDAFAVAGSPAGSCDYPVVPEHRCGSPPLPESTPIAGSQPINAAALTDQCPF